MAITPESSSHTLEGYLETSAKHAHNVDEAFTQMAKACSKPKFSIGSALLESGFGAPYTTIIVIYVII